VRGEAATPTCVDCGPFVPCRDRRSEKTTEVSIGALQFATERPQERTVSNPLTVNNTSGGVKSTKKRENPVSRRATAIKQA